jgi:hypothetical protein
MNERSDIGRILSHLELLMKELEIAFEQYFAGVEKRAPLKERELMARRLRQFASRHIVQTDLRFRYQNLATRFHSYGAYWDRILRLIEEGRYSRQQGALPKTPPAKALPTPPGPDAAPPQAEPPPGGTPAAGGRDVDTLYKELAAAHAACHLKVPQRQQIEEFLTQQRDKIRQRFGDRPVEFRVEIEGGKPKLKVKAKE